MTREEKADLEALQRFVSQYSLKAVSTDCNFQALLKQQHGKSLGVLIAVAELAHQRTSRASQCQAVDNLPSVVQLAYLKESVSDLGQSLFCWAHGAYKASRVMLRSSIETFVKGMACRDQPTVLTEKNLYKVFEIASQTPIFSTSGALFLKELSDKYGILSEDVHTAGGVNMALISALNYFPTFQLKAAKKGSDLLVYVATRQLLSLCIGYNAAFHQMHHRNRETILDNVPKSYRKRIHNLD